MDDAYAPPTPLTGPYVLPRLRAFQHWLGRSRERARVYVLPDGACRVVRRGERLNLHAAVAGGYRGVYFVDEDSHAADVECELPSNEPGLLFTARVRLIWWVHDVEHAVQSRVGDVRHAVRPFLESYLGRTSRAHPVSALGAAEDHLRREIAGGDLPLEIGVTIRPLTISLRMEDAAASYDERISDVHREIMLEEARGRLEVLRARNEVAAWQIRLAFYHSVVESGLPAVLALRLMVDPSSAGEVAQFTQVAALPEGTERSNGTKPHPPAHGATAVPQAWQNWPPGTAELVSGTDDAQRPPPP